MIDLITNAIYVTMIFMPFITAFSTYYLARLVFKVVQPPMLLTLLFANASVVLVTSTYLATLRILTGVLDIIIPSNLLPITLLTIIAPMIMTNIIIFMLRRYRSPSRSTNNAQVLKAAKETAASAKETSNIADTAVEKAKGQEDSEFGSENDSFH